MSVQKIKYCGFTGHRNSKLPSGTDISELRSKIAGQVAVAYNDGYRGFICGFCRGCDLYFARAVIELKKSDPSVILVASLPFPQQDERWRPFERNEYRELMKSANVIRCFFSGYCIAGFHVRNDYTVAKSSRIIAVFNGAPGGTSSTIAKAKKAGVEVVVV